MVKDHSDSKRKEGNVLFNDTLNTFYLRLYGVRHVEKDHTDSERGRKEMFYLMTHSTHFIYGYMERERNVLFNDTQHILFTVIWRRTYGKGPLR